MTVAELIAWLETQPGDRVVLHDIRDDYFGHVARYEDASPDIHSVWWNKRQGHSPQSRHYTPTDKTLVTVVVL